MPAVRSERSHLAHAARVAAVATMVIAVFYVVVVGALDYFVARRVLWEVDQGLTDRLSDVTRTAVLHLAPVAPDEQGSDGVPIFAWSVPSRGTARALTDGSPPLALDGRSMSTAPRTLSAGNVSYRIEAARTPGGWMVVGQSLAGADHIDQVLFDGEWIVGPIVLLAVFAGSLVIGIQASAPVEQARRRVLEFTADASHELRTPLTVMEAEIELARADGADLSPDREALDRIARESGRLKQIVEDLLWLARFDSTPLPHHREPVELTAVVERSAERFAAVAATRSQDLRTHRNGENGAWVDGTFEWLDRLAGTLIDNACRYTPAGGTVLVSIQSEGGRVAITVEDSGPGIPPADRVRLFDRFHRASTHPDGAGLGLAIADSVVRSTGGRWRVGDSDLGGALLEVSWRRAAPPVPLRGAEPTPGNGGVRPGTEPGPASGTGTTGARIAPSVDA
ncbi:MAG: sensor histidine kinase [Acidimicrobiales bacterium]